MRYGRLFSSGSDDAAPMTHKTYIVFFIVAVFLFLKPLPVTAASNLEDKQVVGSSGTLIVSSSTKTEGIELATIKKDDLSIPSASLQRFPLEKEDFLGISQGFHAGHAGIDIRGKLNSKLYPIMNGKVLEVKFEAFGYGHHIIIQHEDGTIALYAHMNEVFVKPGEDVSTVRAIGTLGLTGRTTGPHLHLEIMDAQKMHINPTKLIKFTE